MAAAKNILKKQKGQEGLPSCPSCLSSLSALPGPCSLGQTVPWSFRVTGARPLYVNFCTRRP